MPGLHMLWTQVLLPCDHEAICRNLSPSLGRPRSLSPGLCSALRTRPAADNAGSNTAVAQASQGSGHRPTRSKALPLALRHANPVEGRAQRVTPAAARAKAAARSEKLLRAHARAERPPPVASVDQMIAAVTDAAPQLSVNAGPSVPGDTALGANVQYEPGVAGKSVTVPDDNASRATKPPLHGGTSDTLLAAPQPAGMDLRLGTMAAGESNSQRIAFLAHTADGCSGGSSDAAEPSVAMQFGQPEAAPLNETAADKATAVDVALADVTSASAVLVGAALADAASAKSAPADAAAADATPAAHAVLIDHEARAGGSDGGSGGADGLEADSADDTASAVVTLLDDREIDDEIDQPAVEQAGSTEGAQDILYHSDVSNDGVRCDGALSEQAVVTADADAHTAAKPVPAKPHTADCSSDHAAARSPSARASVSTVLASEAALPPPAPTTPAQAQLRGDHEKPADVSRASAATAQPAHIDAVATEAASCGDAAVTMESGVVAARLAPRQNTATESTAREDTAEAVVARDDDSLAAEVARKDDAVEAGGAAPMGNAAASVLDGDNMLVHLATDRASTAPHFEGASAEADIQDRRESTQTGWHRCAPSAGAVQVA